MTFLFDVKRVPRAKTLRRALGLTQEEFAPLSHPDRQRCTIKNRGDLSQTSWREPI